MPTSSPELGLAPPPGHPDRYRLQEWRFTVADAHLTWTLLLLRAAGVDVAQWPQLADYLARKQARPQVKAAIGIEAALRKTLGA